MLQWYFQILLRCFHLLLRYFILSHRCFLKIICMDLFESMHSVLLEYFMMLKASMMTNFWDNSVCFRHTSGCFGHTSRWFRFTSACFRDDSGIYWITAGGNCYEVIAISSLHHRLRYKCWKPSIFVNMILVTLVYDCVKTVYDTKWHRWINAEQEHQ